MQDPVEYLLPVASDYLHTQVFRDGQGYVYKDFDTFSLKLAESLYLFDYNHRYFADLTFYPMHSLFFHIDITGPPETSEVLLFYFKNVFLNVFEKYLNLTGVTFIVSMRRNRSGGMRLHLPNLKISFDDYQHLCHLMHSECYYKCNGTHITLNCPTRVFLVACDTENSDSLYVPVCVCKVYFGPEFRKIDMVPLPIPKGFSVFNRLRNPLPRWLEAASYMMPFPNSSAKTLSFPTRIVRTDSFTFHSFVDEKDYTIIKQDAISINSENFSCYEFMKRHGNAIRLAPHVSVLNTWHDRFTPKTESGFFEKIEQRLSRECARSLKDVLTCKDYVLPVYYALCNIMEEGIDEIADALAEPDILNNVLILPSQTLTFNTILHVAKQDVWQGWDWILERTETVEEARTHVKCIQEKFFPVVKYKQELYVYDRNAWSWVSDETVLKNVLILIYKQSKLCFDVTKEIESWTRDILNEAMKKKPVSGNVCPSSSVLKERYGCNVPEYYFFPK